MTSIYVAGGWQEKDVLVKPFIHRLKMAGLEITEDWTTAEDVGGDANLSKETRVKAAVADLQGAGDADIFWLCMAGYRGARGSFVELGYALAVRDVAASICALMGPGDPPAAGVKLVIISGPDLEKTIFSEVCDHQFTEHEDAFRFITDVARKEAER
jgi:hypothetical protein